MLRVGQRVLAGNVEPVVADVMHKHIDAAQVVGGDVDLLPEKADPHAIGPQHLHRFQQQRPRPAGGVVHLVHLGLAHGAQPGQQFRHIGGGKELPAGLARVAGVHRHQVFVGVAESVDVVVAHIAQLHVVHAVQQLDQLFVALGHRGAQLVAVDIEVVKQPRHAAFGCAALG